jgi:hypothetical protein
LQDTDWKPLEKAYNELNKKAKRSVRRDWRKYLEGLAEKAQRRGTFPRFIKPSINFRENQLSDVFLSRIKHCKKTTHNRSVMKS